MSRDRRRGTRHPHPARRGPRRHPARALAALGCGLLAALAAPAGMPSGEAATDCTQRSAPVYLPQPPYALEQFGATRDGVGLRSLGFDGSGVLVAVLDSGVEAANPHFAGAAGTVGTAAAPALVPGTSLVPVVEVTRAGVHPQGWSDPSGHGTSVAGIIAARAVPGSGVVGLAPGAVVLPVQVYLLPASDDARLAPAFPSVAQLAAGIRYAVDRGARILTVAMSTPQPDAALEQAVAYARSRGALVVASAGDRLAASDTRDSPRYPAAYPGVLGVTAVTQAGQVTPAAIHGPHVGVAAPGERIPTAFGRWGDCVVGDAPASSYAVPYVAATAALLAQAFPAEGPDLWRYRIEASALRPRSDRRDDQLGWGIVSPYDALTLTLDPERPGPPLPGQVRAVGHPVAAPAYPVEVAPDPLADERRLGLWLIGAALAGALLLRLVRALREPGP